jgi:hypothetical protein
MNFRDTAWIREAHDDLRCPELCPHCRRIEDVEHERQLGHQRAARDNLTTQDYEEYR